MTQTNLLPCPFCGGEAEITRCALDTSINCTDCECAMDFDNTLDDEAIAIWNTRYTPKRELVTND